MFHVSNILKHLAGFLVHFFLGVVSIGVWTNNLTRKDLWTSHVASWNLVEEALESILGKAYFAFMCARWAVLFFWEVNSWINTGCVVKGGEVEGDAWWLHGKIVHQDGQKERCVIKYHFPSSHHHGSLEMDIVKETIFLEGAGIPVNREYGAQTEPANEVSSLFPELIFGKDRHELLADAKSALWQADKAGAWCWDGVVMSRMMKKDRSCFKTQKLRNYFRSSWFHIVSHCQVKVILQPILVT